MVLSLLAGAALLISQPDWAKDLPPQARWIALQVATDTTPAPPAVITPAHQKDLDDDIALGKKVAEEVAKELKSSTSQPMIDRVNRIGGELARIARTHQVEATWGDRRLNPFNYEFHVIAGDDVNAFSIPGGYIYIYEGLLKFAETDHEVAGVIGHEIAHASFRHVATLRREQSKLEAITLPLILIGLLAGGEAGQGAAIGTQLAGQAIGSGWSVKAEKSADYGGLQYILKSGYNPVGLLTFIERLAYEERTRGEIDWGIYRTHPPNRERVTAIRAMLENANIDIRRSGSSTTFRAIPVDQTDGTFAIKVAGKNVVVFSGEDAGSRAEIAATRMTNFLDSNPRVFEMSATAEGQFLGRSDLLFSLTDSDVKFSGKEKEELIEAVLKTLKAAVYDLSYRVGTVRG